MVMTKRSGILLTLALLIGTMSVPPFLAFAQNTTGVAQPGASSVHAQIDQIWTDGGNVRFKVSFLTSSGTVQPHIDYNIIVTSSDGTVMLDAAKKSGQNLLHTAEGVVTVPQEPDSPLKLQNGNYKVNATIYGVLFQPVTPSSYALPFTVTPEFPSGVILATAGMLGLVVAIWRFVSTRPH
jgi:hypothetical protein